MALYAVVMPCFTYRSASGLTRHVQAVAWTTTRFDTTNPELDLPPGWTPPVIGLRPMDAAAKAALDSVRAPYVGQQLPGIGLVSDNEQIWVP